MNASRRREQMAIGRVELHAEALGLTGMAKRGASEDLERKY